MNSFQKWRRVKTGDPHDSTENEAMHRTAQMDQENNDRLVDGVPSSGILAIKKPCACEG